MGVISIWILILNPLLVLSLNSRFRSGKRTCHDQATKTCPPQKKPRNQGATFSWKTSSVQVLRGLHEQGGGWRPLMNVGISKNLPLSSHKIALKNSSDIIKSNTTRPGTFHPKEGPKKTKEHDRTWRYRMPYRGLDPLELNHLANGGTLANTPKRRQNASPRVDKKHLGFVFWASQAE